MRLSALTFANELKYNDKGANDTSLSIGKMFRKAFTVADHVRESAGEPVRQPFQPRRAVHEFNLFKKRLPFKSHR